MLTNRQNSPSCGSDSGNLTCLNMSFHSELLHQLTFILTAGSHLIKYYLRQRYVLFWYDMTFPSIKA